MSTTSQNQHDLIEVKLKTRYSFKHDTEENWKKATNFKPLIYEPIMYDPDDTHSEVRYKLGDGINYINDLPFCSAPIVEGAGEHSAVVNDMLNNKIIFTPNVSEEYAFETYTLSTFGQLFNTFSLITIFSFVDK